MRGLKAGNGLTFLKGICSTKSNLRSIHKSSCFVTTPIFYVNGEPHIGHLYSAVIADAHYRYNVMLNGEDKQHFLFSTGTDEHGMKIEKAAVSLSRTPKQHCDSISNSFNRICKTFSIRHTDFIRTTESRHKETVSHLWKTLNDKGYIYKSHYEGWYCTADETFLSDSQIIVKDVPGVGSVKVSSESGHPVEWSSEENYMFKLEKLRPSILSWLRDKTPVIPSKFSSIVIKMLEESCNDLSISRPSSRLSWGIPVPNDPSQVIYVWLDALANYLTVSGYPSKNHIWPPTVQIVGKDILKFHAIYWPAFLMAADLELPRQILCHSHWIVDNVKMSKSLGNVVDPFNLAQKYGSDAVRYFLLREGVPHSDGNFNEEKLRRMVNAELADTFGNLLSRCTSKALNTNQIWPEFKEESFLKLKSTNGLALRKALEILPDTVEENYKAFNYYRSLENIMSVLRLANLCVEEEKPWELVKISPNDPNLLVLISLIFEVLRVTGIMIWPIIPNLSSLLLDRLNIPQEDRSWKSIHPFIWDQQTTDLPLGHLENVLFRRVKL